MARVASGEGAAWPGEGQTLRLFLAAWELAQLDLTLRILEEVGPPSNLQERLWFFSDEHRCVEFFVQTIPGSCCGSGSPLVASGPLKSMLNPHVQGASALCSQLVTLCVLLEVSFFRDCATPPQSTSLFGFLPYDV